MVLQNGNRLNRKLEDLDDKTLIGSGFYQPGRRSRTGGKGLVLWKHVPREGSYKALKAGQTNPPGLTGLVV